MTRTVASVGTIMRWSTSRSRKCPSGRSVVGVMYESNERSLKSVYSYVQYHWWPMAFRVMSGSLISSIIYRIRRDGRARVISTIAGRIVQTSSIACALTVFDDSFCVSIRVNRYRTRLQIARATIKAWSWNWISSSMIGDEAS